MSRPTPPQRVLSQTYFWRSAFLNFSALSSTLSWSALILAAVRSTGCLMRSDAEGRLLGSGWIISWEDKKGLSHKGNATTDREVIRNPNDQREKGRRRTGLLPWEERGTLEKELGEWRAVCPVWSHAICLRWWEEAPPPRRWPQWGPERRCPPSSSYCSPTEKGRRTLTPLSSCDRSNKVGETRGQTSCKTSLARYLLSPSSTWGLFTLVTWPRSPGERKYWSHEASEEKKDTNVVTRLETRSILPILYTTLVVSPSSSSHSSQLATDLREMKMLPGTKHKRVAVSFWAPDRNYNSEVNTKEDSLGLMSMCTREVEWMYLSPRVTCSSRSFSSSSGR